MLGLAQTMPLLVATPLAGHLASRFGLTTALVGLAAVLLATTSPPATPNTAYLPQPVPAPTATPAAHDRHNQSPSR